MIDSIPLFGDAPLLGQDQETFDKNCSDTLGKMGNFVEKTNFSIGQINANSKAMDSNLEKSIEAMNTTVEQAEEAIRAKEYIEQYTIPNEATYNTKTIDDKVRMSQILNMTNSI